LQCKNIPELQSKSIPPEVIINKFTGGDSTNCKVKMYQGKICYNEHGKEIRNFNREVHYGIGRKGAVDD